MSVSLLPDFEVIEHAPETLFQLPELTMIVVEAILEMIGDRVAVIDKVGESSVEPGLELFPVRWWLVPMGIHRFHEGEAEAHEAV